MTAVLESMPLWFHFPALLVELAVLVLGGELLVRGAAGLAARLGLSPMVIGATVVALGTSFPEFIVSLIAVFSGFSAVAVGNVLGSNMANVGLVLGLSMFLGSAVSSSKTSRGLAFFYLFLLLLLPLLIILEGTETLGSKSGLIMLGLLGLFLWWMFKARDPVSSNEQDSQLSNLMVPWKIFLCLISGSFFLYVGSDTFVASSVTIARQLGVSELVIGLSIVAVGTSLPELVASLVAIIRRENELGIGNIIGSNILNILFVLGSVCLLQPVVFPLFSHSSTTISYVLMSVFGLLLLPGLLLKNQFWQGRMFGMAVFLTYCLAIFLFISGQF